MLDNAFGRLTYEDREAAFQRCDDVLAEFATWPFGSASGGGGSGGGGSGGVVARVPMVVMVVRGEDQTFIVAAESRVHVLGYVMWRAGIEDSVSRWGNYLVVVMVVLLR